MKKFILSFISVCLLIPAVAQQADYLDDYGDAKVLLPDGGERINRLRNGSIVTRYNGLLGLSDGNGKWIIQPRFRYMKAVPVADTAQVIVIQNEMSGVMDLHGNQIIPCVYDSIAIFSTSWLFTSNLSPEYGDSEVSGAAYMAFGDGIQLYDAKGMPKISDPKKSKLTSITRIDFVVDRGYVMMGCKSNGLCAVISPEYRFISDFIYDPRYVDVMQTQSKDNHLMINGDQITKVNVDGGVSLFNVTTGEHFANCVFDELKLNSNNGFIVAEATVGNGKFVVNRRGEKGVLFNDAFKSTEIDSLDQLWYRYTGNPEYGITTEYLFEGMSEGCASYQVVKLKGESIMIPQYWFGHLNGYSHCDYINDGNAYSFTQDKKGITDDMGNEILEPIFDLLEGTPRAEMIIGMIGYKYGLYDYNGDELVKPEYDDFYHESDNTIHSPYASSGRFIQFRKGNVNYLYDLDKRKMIDFSFTEMERGKYSQIYLVTRPNGKKTAIGGGEDGFYHAIPGEYDELSLASGDGYNYLLAKNGDQYGLYRYLEGSGDVMQPAETDPEAERSEWKYPMSSKKIYIKRKGKYNTEYFYIEQADGTVQEIGVYDL